MASHDPATRFSHESGRRSRSRPRLRIDATTSPRAASHDATVTHDGVKGRAVVLGGGGSTGNAWLIGVIAGLLDGHLDVATADTTIGTSAGATAAAQLAGATPTDLLSAITAAGPAEPTGPVTADPRGGPNRPVVEHLERTNKIIADA